MDRYIHGHTLSMTAFQRPMLRRSLTSTRSGLFMEAASPIRLAGGLSNLPIFSLLGIRGIQHLLA